MTASPTYPCVRRVLVSGSSGTIGTELLTALRGRGCKVACLSRQTKLEQSAPAWDPLRGSIDAAAIAEFCPDAVVHLAGESVFGRWNSSKRQRILDSRVRGTRTLVACLNALPTPPRAFLSASAVGYYGHSDNRAIGESAPPGAGFLAEVCQRWEQEASAASPAIRTSLLRIGVVLSPSGGALASLLPLFRLGLGGPLAGGRTWVPWISLADTIGAILHVLERPDIRGPINVVGPNPVQQGQFARALGAKLGRPAALPIPRWALTAAMGELARETVLKSIRTVPGVLVATGYPFIHPTLDAALDAALPER